MTTASLATCPTSASMSRSHSPHSSLLCGTIKLRFLFNTLVTSTNPFFFFTTWIAQFSLRGLARHVRAVRDKGFVGFQPVGFHGCEEGRLDEGAFRGECGAGFDESESEGEGEGEGEGEVCVGLGDEERGGGPCGWEVEVRGVFQEEFCGGEVFGEGGEVEGRALVVIGVVGNMWAERRRERMSRWLEVTARWRAVSPASGSESLRFLGSSAIFLGRDEMGRDSASGIGSSLGAVIL